jgi:hypothetical protein
VPVTSFREVAVVATLGTMFTGVSKSLQSWAHIPQPSSWFASPDIQPIVTDLSRICSRSGPQSRVRDAGRPKPC